MVEKHIFAQKKTNFNDRKKSFWFTMFSAFSQIHFCCHPSTQTDTKAASEYLFKKAAKTFNLSKQQKFKIKLF